MIESRACPECGAEVPIGRLSCGACGALLASVDRHGAAEPAIDQQPSSSSRVVAPAGLPALGEDAVPGPTEVPATMAPPLEQSAAAPPPGSVALEDIEPPRPPMPPIPGGYLVPSAVMRSAPIIAAPPVPTTPAPAPGLPHGGPEPAPGEPAPSEHAPGVPAPGVPAPGSATRAPVLELPFAIAPGIGPRLVAAGAALAIVAFVLPWIPGGGVVIGAAFGSGYFATWGLAAVGNVLPFLLAWVSLTLAVLPNRVPRIAALGLLPVLLGGVFAGFGWTYLIAPFGTGIGIWALGGSALLLAAGGSLVLRGDRAT